MVGHYPTEDEEGNANWGVRESSLISSTLSDIEGNSSEDTKVEDEGSFKDIQVQLFVDSTNKPETYCKT